MQWLRSSTDTAPYYHTGRGVASPWSPRGRTVVPHAGQPRAGALGRRGRLKRGGAPSSGHLGPDLTARLRPTAAPGPKVSSCPLFGTLFGATWPSREAIPLSLVLD